MRLLPLQALILTATLAAQSPAPTVVGLAADNADFETLTAAVQAADLTDTLAGDGPFTVFAPTDRAFAKLGKKKLSALLQPERRTELVGLLTLHVVKGHLTIRDIVQQTELVTLQGQRLPVALDGGEITIGGARIRATDLQASNGIVHAIDAVLMPTPKPAVADDLVAAATKAGTFTALLAAADAAGLVDTLRTGGPFTVFAPDDAAFAALGDCALQTLLKPENKPQLAAVLKLHIVPGALRADRLQQRRELTALTGASLAIGRDGDHLTVGGARVTATDVLAGNGVIHVLDRVLLPQHD